MTQSRFDGLAVDEFKARFAGTFDLADRDAMQMGLDGEVMIVVVARLNGASITETSTGDVRRTNKLAVRSVAVVRSQLDREEIADRYGLETMQQQFPFSAPPDEPEPEAPGTVNNFVVLDNTGFSPTVLPSADFDALLSDLDNEPDVPDRVLVGGARQNDPALAKFLEVS